MLNKLNKKGFTLVEIVIVIAIIGILAAVTVVALKPAEIFANGRNSRRVSDVSSLRTAVSQWLAREGADDDNAFTTLGATAVLDPSDGVGDNEGVPASSLTALVSAGYLQSIPNEPGGDPYRVGVDDVTNPSHVFICTNDIENTSTYPASDYPNGVFCQSV